MSENCSKYDCTSSCNSHFLTQALDHLGVDDEMRRLLQSSNCEARYELPLRRENGSIEQYHGYRVQHDRSRGPFNTDTYTNRSTPVSRHAVSWSPGRPASSTILAPACLSRRAVSVACSA